MAKADPMHDEFLGWMTELEIDPDEKLRTARWKSLQAINSRLTTGQTESLVRLSFEMTRLRPSDEERDALVQTFKKNDPTFQPSHGRQLELLAGIALASKLDTRKNLLISGGGGGSVHFRHDDRHRAA